jgi:hypothetical protein
MAEELKLTNEETARLLYENGMMKYCDPEASKEDVREAVKLIIEACNRGNADAEFFVGRETLAGRITLNNKEPMEHALGLLRRSANSGNMNARCLLNSYCEDKDQFKKTVSERKDRLRILTEK